MNFPSQCYRVPQTFDNWIHSLFKVFQGQQQQFSGIYFKARPPLPPLLALRSSQKCFAESAIALKLNDAESAIALKLDDADAEVGQ